MLETQEGLLAFVHHLAARAVQGDDPEAITAERVRAGYDEALTQTCCAGVGITFQGISKSQKPQKIAKALRKKLGVPEPVAFIILQGVFEAIQPPE